MLFSIDVETACAVDSCPYHGKAKCENGHSLNPWQSVITVIAVADEDLNGRVFRGPNKVNDVRTYIEERYPNYTLENQAFKFDWLHLARHGWVIDLDRWAADSQLASYICTDKIPDAYIAEYDEKRRSLGGSHRPGSKHGLKTAAPYFLGVEPFWEPQDGNLDDDDYVLKDAIYAKLLRRNREAKLKELGQFEFYQRQIGWVKMLLQAEWRGICIDMAAVEKLEPELREQETVLRQQLDEQWTEPVKERRSLLVGKLQRKYEQMAAAQGKLFHYGTRHWFLYENAREKCSGSLNYASPAQMLWLLRDHLGYDCISLKTGKDSTEADVLERLANEGKKDVETFLKWREVNKLLTTYIPNFKNLAVREGNDWVIHPIYNPDSTRTGRTSSERPNMQNYPERLRPIFVPRSGCVFVGFDMAAIEARLIALYTNDPVLYELITSGISLHDFNTVNYFELDCSYDEVKKSYNLQRKAAKNVGFALFYHAGAKRIAAAFAQAGFPITLARAKQIHERFKQAFQVAMRYAGDFVKTMEAGEVVPNLLGRPLSIEDPEDAYMKAFNKLIQSSASDLLLEGAQRAGTKLREAGVKATPLLFVHDFVGFEVPEERAQEASEIVKTCLINFELSNTLGTISLEVEGGITPKWEK